MWSFISAPSRLRPPLRDRGSSLVGGRGFESGCPFCGAHRCPARAEIERDVDLIVSFRLHAADPPSPGLKRTSLSLFLLTHYELTDTRSLCPASIQSNKNDSVTVLQSPDGVCINIFGR